MALTTVQVELKEANEFVARFHRHHKPCTGHRFSIGVGKEDGALVGVAICGRPVARGCNHKTTIEVSRLCTDGTKHACSFLYAKSARIAKELGYKKIQTYILDTEDGVSLVAAGWVKEADTAGGQWTHTDGKPRRKDQPTNPKQRWAKTLN